MPPDQQQEPPSSQLDVTDENQFQDMSLTDVLDDLSSRFLLNLPPAELSSIERLGFQIEQAHWYYEDFAREQNKTLPSMPIKKFTQLMFRACPMLREFAKAHEEAFERFMKYKLNVPVCGAIILNELLDKCILVKGWKTSSGWGFPKGKINQTETKAECAAREVDEEVGFDLTDYLVEEHKICMMIKDQEVTLYIVCGVPESTVFLTRTRKEISKIEWFRLVDLPTWKRNHAAAGKFYLITPFIGPLKEFVKARRAELKQHQNASTSKTSRKTKTQVASADGAAVPAGEASSAVDSLFARITVSRSSSTPAPDESPASGSSADPHMARLMQNLFTSATGLGDTSSSSEPESSRSATPTDTSSSHHSPVVDPSKTPRVNGISVPSADERPPSSLSLSSSASSSSASHTKDKEVQRKRSMHLALLQSVDEELTRATTPLLRPATTSPVRALHPPVPLHANSTMPPPLINHHAQQSHHGPPYHPNQQFPQHSPLHATPHLNLHVMRPPLPLNPYPPLHPGLRGAPAVNPMLHAGLVDALHPVAPLSAGPIFNGFANGIPGLANGFAARGPLAPLQLANNFVGVPPVSYGGVPPPMSAGPLSAGPLSAQQQQQHNHLLALLNQRGSGISQMAPGFPALAPTGPVRPSTAALSDLQATPVPARQTLRKAPAPLVNGQPNLALQALNGAMGTLNGSGSPPQAVSSTPRPQATADKAILLSLLNSSPASTAASRPA
ncbi:Dcp2, box A domain-containing protein [Auriculariales sp. MPI-PUGE-AT-0066]|nr:Dcp2, box A domain-containing protein [Auriculariales sp. MPI-PUGE-AT-0066]